MSQQPLFIITIPKYQLSHSYSLLPKIPHQTDILPKYQDASFN